MPSWMAITSANQRVVDTERPIVSKEEEFFFH
jgi:hypothetical protein